MQLIIHVYSNLTSEIIQVAFNVFKEVLLLFRGRLLRMGVPIQDIVLEHENKIKDDWHNTEHPLHYVEAAARKGRLAMSHCLDYIL